MSASQPDLLVAKIPTAGLVGRRALAAQACALFALAYLPYAQWFGQRLPVDVFGFSLMASVLPLILVLVATLDLAQVGRTSGVRLVAGFGLIAATIVALRFLDGVGNSPPLEVSAVRWLIVIPAWTVVFRDLLGERRVRDWARRLLVANTLLAAGMGIVYRLGLADIRLSSPTFAEQGLTDPLAQVITRASGLWLNPNLFGAFLLLGVALLLLGSRLSLRWTLPALALLVVGIGTSGSRWPLGAALLLLAFLAFRRPIHFRFSGALQIGILFIVIIGLRMLFASGDTSLAQLREHADLRLIKSSVGWRVLTARPDTILVGADPNDLLSAASPDLAFSDNGWLQMSLTVGIPVTALFIAALWRVMRRPPRSRERAAFAFIVIGTMTVNSANLWDPWIACAAATFWLISYTAGETAHRAVSAQRPGLPPPTRGLRPRPVTSRVNSWPRRLGR